jgi:hypothetical protein
VNDTTIQGPPSASTEKKLLKSVAAGRTKTPDKKVAHMKRRDLLKQSALTALASTTRGFSTRFPSTTDGRSIGDNTLADTCCEEWNQAEAWLIWELIAAL